MANLLRRIIVLILMVSSASVAQTEISMLQENFDKLSSLSQKSVKQGLAESDRETLCHVRDSYLEHPAEAAAFLAGRLSILNREETEFFGEPTKPADAVAFFKSTHNTEPLKYFLAFVLADLYEKASDDQKTAIREAILGAYTPTSYFRTELELLNRALLTIGEDAIPLFVRLGEHEKVIVRCEAEAILNNLADDAPLQLECKAPRQERARQLHEWLGWWTGRVRPLKIPRPPDFFAPAGCPTMDNRNKVSSSTVPS
jgi:hypothetical protein